MKSMLFSFLFLFGLIQEVVSQEKVREGLYFNKGGRQVWIVGMDGNKTSRALLIKVSKDSVFYAETILKTIAAQSSGLEIKRLHYSEIDTMVTLKNKPGARGSVTGGIIGFAAGIAIRAVTYDPDPITQFAVGITGGEGPYYFGAGLLGATVGVAAGAGIGTISKKKWVLNGKQSNYEQNILELDKRAYWNRSSRPK